MYVECLHNGKKGPLTGEYKFEMSWWYRLKGQNSIMFLDLNKEIEVTDHSYR